MHVRIEYSFSLSVVAYRVQLKNFKIDRLRIEKYRETRNNPFLSSQYSYPQREHGMLPQ